MNKWLLNPAVALLALSLVLCAALAPRSGLAQPYAVNNPTYIPTAVLAPQLITPGQGSSFVYQTNGQGTLYMRISGAPSGLSAAVQATEGRNPLTIAATVTMTIATPGVVSWTGHGLSINQPVVFTTTGALPTGITAGTTYYVIAAGLTANAFEVAASPGGAAINTTGSQSGTHTGTSTSVQWTSMSVDMIGSGAAATTPRTNAITAAGLYRLNVAGLAQVRLNVAALTSGVTYVDFSAGPSAEMVRVSPLVRATYRAAASIATGATTNFFVIAGSATKTIFVSRAECSGRATAAIVVGINAELHSAVDTGDAGTAVTAVPLDSNYAAATATVVSHTTSPTPGTVVGSVAQGQLGIVLAAPTATDFPMPNVLAWDFGTRPGTPPIMLRGVAQSLSLSTNAAFGTGAAVTCSFEWQED